MQQLLSNNIYLNSLEILFSFFLHLPVLQSKENFSSQRNTIPTCSNCASYGWYSEPISNILMEFRGKPVCKVPSGPDTAPKSVFMYSLKVLAGLINNKPLLLPMLNRTLMLVNLHPELLYH